MATIDDKDRKIGEVPHLENVTGKEKIPVSAGGEPRYVEAEQIAGLVKGLPDITAMPRDNEIIYVTNDSKAITPYSKNSIISNEYYPALGYGVLKVKENSTMIDMWFREIKTVTKVIFPKQFTSATDYVFYQCSALEEVIHLGSNYPVSSRCFYDCTRLRNVYPNLQNKTIVGGASNYSFYNCVSLDINRLEYAGQDFSFYGCTQIKELVLTNATSFFSSSFVGLTGLERFIAKGTTTIPSNTSIFSTTVTPKYIDTETTTSINRYPRPDKLETLILRGSKVVPDLATYATTFSTPAEGRTPVMPVPVAQSDSTMESDEPTAVANTLDVAVPMAYIGTPNNWLKIYVPQNLLAQYQETYPTLKEYLHPITGEDIYALKEDVNQKIEEIEAKIPSGDVEGVTWGKISKKYPEPTVIRLNQTITDSSKMLSGEFGKDGDPATNVISYIRANSHRYVGNYDEEQGMILRQLDDNNSELYADGSDASEDIKGTNGGDVFMKMPDFWFKGVDVDGNPDIVDMHFSVKDPQDETWTKWDGNTLIGAYKGYVVDDVAAGNLNGLRSWSGVSLYANISQQDFKAIARKRSNGNDHFQLVTYEAHQAMALLFMAWYGKFGLSTTVGGWGNSTIYVAGATNEIGMMDGMRGSNYWGLENWIGCNGDEYIDNLKSKIGINDNGNLAILNYDGEEVRTIGGCATVSYELSIIKMKLGEKLDMVSILNTSGYKGYGSEGLVSVSEGRVGYQSCAAGDDLDRAGAFKLWVGANPTTKQDYIVSRLLYTGRVKINNTAPVAMKKSRAIAPTWRPIDLQYVYRNGTPVIRTGMDFNVCDVSTLEEVGKLSLYGLNINYDEIEFESNAAHADAEGNIIFDTDGMPQSIDMTYNGKLIGTLKFYDFSEEELIKRQREERRLREQSENA